MPIELCGRPDCGKAAQVLVVLVTVTWVGVAVQSPALSMAVCDDHAASIRYLMARLGGVE